MRTLIGLTLLLTTSFANALTCGTNQTPDPTNTSCVCQANYYMSQNGSSCLTAQGLAAESNQTSVGGIAGYNISSPSTINMPLDATTEVAPLQSTYSASNTNNIGLSSFGTNKINDCASYVPNPSAPNPRKDAECAAVNDLNKYPVSNYVAKTGFNKNDAVFGSAAYKAATADPTTIITPQATTTSGACTAVQKTSPATYITGQCIRVAAPTATTCTSQINPIVTVKNFCNASGTGVSRGFYAYSGNGGLTYPINANVADGDYTISYSCSPPDPNGNQTSIQATINIGNGAANFTGGCNCPYATQPLNITFTPGVSVAPVTALLACNGNWGGMLGGCSVTSRTATVWYDGPTDKVYVQGASSYNYGMTGFDSSCPLGQTFTPATIGSYTYTTKYGTKTAYYEATPSYCSATPPPAATVTSVAKLSATAYVSGRPTTVYSCPTGAYGWNTSTGLQCAYVTCSTGFSVYANGQGYFACIPPPSELHYAPFDHYTGGAGVASTLNDVPVESNPSCEALQAKSYNNGVSNVTYPATLATTYSCPTNWTMTGTAAPYSCNFQPPPYAATVTNTYSCPNGTLTGGTNCTVQPPTYTAFSSDIFTCNVGDTITGGVCANGGTMSNGTSTRGAMCTYLSIPATPAYTCGSGLTLNGSICYTNPALASTLTVVDNVNSFYPVSTTYSCDVNHTLSGTQCIPIENVTCDHQPPSIPALETMHYKCMPSMSGNYTITYITPAIDTNPIGLCVANVNTKASTLQSLVCPTNYSWNGSTGQCEYQRPNYSAF